MKIAACALLVLVVCATIALALGGCAATAQDFTQDEAKQYVALADEEIRLEKSLGDERLPVDERAKIAARQTEVKAALDAIEVAVETRKNGSIITAIGHVIPGGDVVVGLLGAALVPLVGPRGRKHFGNLIKSATPGTGRSAGNLLADLKQYIGMTHSDPEDRPGTAAGSPVVKVV